MEFSREFLEEIKAEDIKELLIELESKLRVEIKRLVDSGMMLKEIAKIAETSKSGLSNFTTFNDWTSQWSFNKILEVSKKLGL